MRGIIAFLLLGLAGPAWAELVICGDATASFPTPAFTGHLSVDPTKAPATLGGKPCYVIPKASGETASQLAIIDGTPRQYLKVVSQRVVAMTAGEQSAWDAARQAFLDARQALLDEATGQDVCSTITLDAINTLLTNRRATLQTAINTAKTNNQADIDAMPNNNLGTIKAAFTQMNNVIFAVAGNLLDETFAIDQKLARCIVVLRQGVR